MHFQNVNLDTYPYKEFIELFDKFKGEIYPWVGNFFEAPTGEKYWCVTQNGNVSILDDIHLDGQKIVPYETYEVAFHDYKIAVLTLFELYSGTLYFRFLPSVEYHIEKGKDNYMIWSRFLISDNPMIQFADDNKNK